MGDSNSKEITVKTELGDVVVHKMPLSDYAELLRALSTLPKKLGELIGGVGDIKQMADTDFLVMLPGIIADSWNDLGSLLAVPTDKDAAFLMQLDGADAVDVIDAIMELNDFVRIVNAVKKMLARQAKTANPTPAPQK
jgi:hypothetical protein